MFGHYSSEGLWEVQVRKGHAVPGYRFLNKESQTSDEKIINMS